MLDLETLGQKPGSVIVAIGAAKFGNGEIIDTFYRRVDPESCVAIGLRMDAQTVMWWLRQESASRLEITWPGVHVCEVLRQFAVWLGDKDAEIWGNGAGFDNVLLADAYDRAQLPLPWNWYNDRCYRTVKNLRPDVPMTRAGTHHNALDDAKSQAMHLMALLAGPPVTQRTEDPKRTVPTGRLKAADAEARAKEIRALRARGMTHQQIADELGLKRELVSSYLSSRCKAAVRAGVNQ